MKFKQYLQEDTGLKTALEAYKPQLEASYKRFVESMFGSLTSRYGKNMKGIYNSPSVANWRNLVQPNVKKVYAVVRMSYSPGEGEYVIDPEALNKNADRWAVETIDTWFAKIESKLGQLEAGKVHHLDGVRFRISGTRAGHEVEIIQDMIVNVSSKGTLFNQFPARIRVDKKAISEKQFKEQFGIA